jgi:hypothetical protein
MNAIKQIIKEMIEIRLSEQPFSKHKAFEKGRNDWQDYVNLNGYAFRPNKEGLKKLSQKTGRKVSDLQKSINNFLEA